MNNKRKLFKAIVEEGGLMVDDFTTELVTAAEGVEFWRLRLKRDVSFIWGGVERVLPAGAALGEIYIGFTAGEPAEDVPYRFLGRPEMWGRSVDDLEREMLDAE